jgi:hypothetical protein
MELSGKVTAAREASRINDGVAHSNEETTAREGETESEQYPTPKN